jgi:nitroimidazol reductase NimA-like FMN-containing flavoprotein (pyridoxamine 5'-phosphate oxidase superfamily)
MTTRKKPASGRTVLSAVNGRASPAPESAARKHALQTLSPAECFDLLEPGGIGRVGFASAAGIMMLPVNFAVTGKAIIFRTAPDTLLAMHADGQLSFEVDRLDHALHAGWSVLLHGRARTVTDEREVKRLEDRTHLEPWAAGARDVYVRITPTRVSGRCIEPGWATPPAPDTEVSWPARQLSFSADEAGNES